MQNLLKIWAFSHIFKSLAWMLIQTECFLVLATFSKVVRWKLLMHEMIDYWNTAILFMQKVLVQVTRIFGAARFKSLCRLGSAKSISPAPLGLLLKFWQTNLASFFYCRFSQKLNGTDSNNLDASFVFVSTFSSVVSLNFIITWSFIKT